MREKTFIAFLSTRGSAVQLERVLGQRENIYPRNCAQGAWIS